MFWLRNKKIIFQLGTFIWRLALLPSPKPAQSLTRINEQLYFNVAVFICAYPVQWNTILTFLLGSSLTTSHFWLGSFDWILGSDENLWSLDLNKINPFQFIQSDPHSSSQTKVDEDTKLTFLLGSSLTMPHIWLGSFDLNSRPDKKSVTTWLN